jgi:hypothetical protein
LLCESRRGAVGVLRGKATCHPSKAVLASGVAESDSVLCCVAESLRRSENPALAHVVSIRLKKDESATIEDEKPHEVSTKGLGLLSGLCWPGAKTLNQLLREGGQWKRK